MEIIATSQKKRKRLKEAAVKGIVATAMTSDTELEVVLVTTSEGKKRLLALAMIEAMKVMGINPAEMKVTITGELE